jgi:hypothetical protein
MVSAPGIIPFGIIPIGMGYALKNPIEFGRPASSCVR